MTVGHQPSNKQTEFTISLPLPKIIQAVLLLCYTYLKDLSPSGHNIVLLSLKV